MIWRKYSNLAANSTDTDTIQIPSDTRIFIAKVGAADINIGDNKSSIYTVEWGSDILAVIALTGNTQEISVNQQIVGDGIKSLRVRRYNKSGEAKAMPIWVEYRKT